MSETDTTNKLNALVDYFSSQGNFDHPDMNDVARIGKQFGVSEIDAGKAFFVAREKSSLIEGELLEGGDGSESNRVQNYGPDSVHEMLFKNTGKRKKH